MGRVLRREHSRRPDPLARTLVRTSMRTLIALTLALSATAPTLALAQDHESVRVENFDDGDLVQGTFEQPAGDRVWLTHHHRGRSLISPRAHYTPEMLRSVENL